MTIMRFPYPTSCLVFIQEMIGLMIVDPILLSSITAASVISQHCINVVECVVITPFPTLS